MIESAIFAVLGLILLFFAIFMHFGTLAIIFSAVIAATAIGFLTYKVIKKFKGKKTTAKKVTKE